MLAGALNDTLVLRALGVVAATPVGASGTVGAVTLPDAADAGESPTALAATTEHVYAAPGVRVVTVIGLDAPVPVRVAPPLVDAHVTVYPVTAVPPVSLGAANDTAVVNAALTAPADTPVGWPGAVVGTEIPAVGDDSADAPTELAARAAQV